MQVISLIIVFTSLLYLFFICYLLIISLRIPSKNLYSDIQVAKNISIVIPCRNEAHNIEPLLGSLEKQSFKGIFEILIIDDNSDDTTTAIATAFAQHSRMTIRILHTRQNPLIRLTSKQQAVDFGIKNAAYEWILLTDADMQFSPLWIESFAQSITDDTDLVFGHTAINPDKTFFTRLQVWALEFLFSIAAVFHHAGIPGSCMGNNLMIKKSAYLASGGYTAIGYSITEDRALLYHFLKLGLRTKTVRPFYPHARTTPHRQIRGYIDQLVRWFRGGMSYGGNLLIVGLLFSAQNIAFLFIFSGMLRTLPTVITLVNFGITWIMIMILFRKQHSPVSSLLFPVFQLFLIIGTLLLPALALFKPRLTWKGTSL